MKKKQYYFGPLNYYEESKKDEVINNITGELVEKDDVVDIEMGKKKIYKWYISRWNKMERGNREYFCG